MNFLFDQLLISPLTVSVLGQNIRIFFMTLF